MAHNFSGGNPVCHKMNIAVTLPLSSMSLPRAAIVSTSSEMSTSSVTMPIKIQSSSVPNSGPAKREQEMEKEREMTKQCSKINTVSSTFHSSLRCEEVLTSGEADVRVKLL